MITASILFWLALPLPGYALLRWLSPRDLDSGLMGTVAVSYFYSLGLLSPVSILCYAFEAPMWVFSAAVATSIVAALAVITRRRWWGDSGRLILTGAGLELVIIILDLALGARVGAFTAGDASVHLSRIRSILDHGFHNHDPFVAATHFFPIYHTNIIHALHAACAQLTRCDYLAIWYDSLPWGKLLVYSGSYYMVWAVFQNRWAAWAAALFAVGVRGPFPYIIYPNQLSPYFLTPMIIALAVQACRGTPGWAGAIKLALASVIIGQVHALYVLFCAMGIAPVLGVVATWRLLRKPAEALRIAACAVALAAGLPFILVSKWNTPPANVAAVGEKAAISQSGYFVHAGSHWVMRNPARLIYTLGGGPGNSLAWAAGIACAMACRQRRWAAIVLGVAATNVAIFYTPPLCTFFLKRLGEEWVMERFDYLLGVCHIALVPGAVAKVLDVGGARSVVRALLSCAAVGLGIYATGHVPPDDWETLYGVARLSRRERIGAIFALRDMRSFLKEHIPRGETILTDAVNGIGMVALADYRIVASSSGSNGVPDLLQRRAELETMLAPDTPWDRRLALMRKYNTRFFLPTRPPLDWAEPHVQQFWLGQQGQGGIIQFKWD